MLKPYTCHVEKWQGGWSGTSRRKRSEQDYKRGSAQTKYLHEGTWESQSATDPEQPGIRLLNFPDYEVHPTPYSEQDVWLVSTAN